MGRWFPLWRCTIIGFLWAGGVHGSTVAPLTITELADHSGAILVGRVAGVHSFRADNPRRIESESEFEGVRFWKGAPFPGSGEKFSLPVPGRRVGDMEMRIAGAPLNPDGSTGNNVVNIDDLVGILSAFGSTQSRYDIAPVNTNGTWGNSVVNIDDLVAVLKGFGVCP